jgi:hypothetical protein
MYAGLLTTFKEQLHPELRLSVLVTFIEGETRLILHSMKPTRTNVQNMATPVAAWASYKIFLHVS